MSAGGGTLPAGYSQGRSQVQDLDDANMDAQIKSKIVGLKEAVTAELKNTLKELFAAQLVALREARAAAQQ